MNNGYPENFFFDVVNKFLNKKYENYDKITESHKYHLSLPFIGIHSIKLKRKLVNLIQNYFDVKISASFYTFKIKNYFSLKSKPHSLTMPMSYIDSDVCMMQISLTLVRQEGIWH